jgi:hypothetical protein
MASLKCPHCDAPMPDQRTWAEAALSTLIAAPAVPDMATQRRCDNCGRVSAASDLRHTVADRFNSARLLLWIVAATFLAWVLMRLLAR